MPKTKIKKQAKNKNKDSSTRNVFKLTLVTAGVILFLFCLIFSVIYLFERQYKNKFYPNIKIGKVDLSGQTYLEALDELEKVQEDFDTGLVFKYKDEKLNVPLIYIKDESAGVTVDILKINYEDVLDQAYQIGRSGNWQKDYKNKIKLFFNSEQFYIDYKLTEIELQNILDEKFSEYESPAQNASLSFSGDEIIVLNEIEGEAFNWEKEIIKVKENISNWENKEIELTLQTDYPKLKKEQTDALVTEAEEILNLTPIILVNEDKNWEVEKNDLKNWLMFSENKLILNEETVDAYLEVIALEVEQPVKEGKFSLDIKEDENLEIKQFQQGENGLELKPKKTIEEIEEKWLADKKTKIELVVETTEPKATPENIDDLGIKELLGTGQTNFSNSSYNRIQNIQKGADILNGLLIAPGETFSLIETLGHIDGESGWLPELVIKGNKTIPEYGGGLCQVGSTSFRTAMNAGLEIVERRNHSYSVSYYYYNGKAGVDATIYEPKPDFRFKNDTDNYILWRSRIEGRDIYFEFWGKSDGRKGYFTDPINYNYVSPPETVITEVDDLEPGQLRCSEKAHTGLTAEFDYIIELPDGSEDKHTFKSVYRALPAVCDKGKEKQEAEKTEPSEENTQEPVLEEEKNENKNTNKKKKNN